eukprot:1864984-Rhodomonas_salina.2
MAHARRVPAPYATSIEAIPKSNTRNRVPGTNRTEIAVSCIGFRRARAHLTAFPLRSSFSSGMRLGPRRAALVSPYAPSVPDIS